MATTNVAITIKSEANQVTTDPFNYSRNFNMTDPADDGGIVLTSGLSRTTLSTNTPFVIVPDSNQTTDFGYVFINNTHSGNKDRVLEIKVGTTLVGRLQGGDKIFMPYNLDEDLIIVAPDHNNMIIEYQTFES